MPSVKGINLAMFNIQAEELLKCARAGQPDALALLRCQGESTRSADSIELADAHSAIARENGFPSWTKFAEQLVFKDAIDALEAGDYSWLESLLEKFELSLIDLLVSNGEPQVPMEQAFTWACMLGRTSDARVLLDKGVDPLAGDNTGLNGFHYAVWHGHQDTVKLLLERRVPLEVRNMYGGTVLGCALDGAENRPGSEHVAIIKALLDAGAVVCEGNYPTGNERLDDLLRDHRGQSEKG
jgi:ankyrin repeat protein